MRINLDLMKRGAHGGPGLFFSQLKRNHEHKEVIEEDNYLLQEEERILPKYILGLESIITAISLYVMYLDFKGYSAVPD